MVSVIDRPLSDAAAAVPAKPPQGAAIAVRGVSHWFAQRGAAKTTSDAASAEERHSFAEGLAEHVKEGGHGGQSSDTDTQRDDADMFDAGIGEKPFQVILGSDKNSRD